MKRKLVSVLMCSTMVLGMAMPVMAADKDNADITIGSVIMNNSGEWFAEVMKGQEDAAKDLGVEFSIVSSDNEISKESDNVATFLAQQVDALVISPLATDASIAAVESATIDAGIPVVTWNTTVDTDVTSHIGVVPSELGGNTGKYAVSFVRMRAGVLYQKRKAHPSAALLAQLHAKLASNSGDCVTIPYHLPSRTASI